MAAKRSDIAKGELYVGSAATLTWTVVDEDGALVDITGWTFQLRIDADKADATSGDFQFAVVNSGSSVCTATLTPANMLTLSAFDYWYNLWRTNSGYERLIAEGIFPVGESMNAGA